MKAIDILILLMLLPFALGGVYLLLKIVHGSQGGRVRPSKTCRPLEAANEGDAEAANEVLAGAFSVMDGGKMVVPFGEVPVMVTINGRQMRGLQRIDAQAGNDMAADLGGFIKKRLVGRPIFAGHPYHPDAGEAAKWPDKRSRGSVDAIEVANDAVVIIPKYNGLGKAEVEDGQFVFHSPQWRLKPVMAANGRQEMKDGMPVFRPYSIHSAGLTNNPNIEVPPLVAANEDTSTSDPLDLAELLTMLKEKGVIKEGDSKEAILSALSSLFSTLEWARERKAEMEREAAEMRAAVPDAANEATHAELLQRLLSRAQAIAANESQLNSELETRFNASRKARVTDGLNALIRSGRVTNAEVPALTAELIEAANEEVITERFESLAKVKPKLATNGGVTDGLHGSNKVVMAANEASQRSKARAEKHAEVLSEITGGKAAKPGDSEKAWNIASMRHPDLFKH